MEEAERTDTENTIKATGLQPKPRCSPLNPQAETQDWLQALHFPSCPESLDVLDMDLRELGLLNV